MSIHPINTSCQCTLSTNPLNTAYQQTLSIHSFNAPFQHTLWIHPVNTPCQYTLSIHPVNAHFQQILSTQPINKPFQSTLLTHPFNTPCGYTQFSLLIHVINTSIYQYILLSILPIRPTLPPPIHHHPPHYPLFLFTLPLPPPPPYPLLLFTPPPSWPPFPTVTEYGIGAIQPSQFGVQLRHLDLKNVRLLDDGAWALASHLHHAKVRKEGNESIDWHTMFSSSSNPNINPLDYP